MQVAKAKQPKSSQFSGEIERLLSQAQQVILDKERELKLTLCAILANGHLLIEDMPGMGKTTVVKVFAKLLGLDWNRIQFTNDLLPADILGLSVFDTDRKEFRFQRGPIFSQLLLADELNRATPKTQSACLQAMEERQVSIDGMTHALPKPFFLIATQNPRQTIGTFPLPESQLDRFLIRIRMGYPGRNAEKELLTSESRSEMIQKLAPVSTPESIVAMQTAVQNVHVSDAVINYLQDVIEAGRRQYSGLSTRASLGLLKAAKSWAFIEGRAFVVPEDIQDVAAAVLEHRIVGRQERLHDENERVHGLIASVPLK